MIVKENPFQSGGGAYAGYSNSGAFSEEDSYLDVVSWPEVLGLVAMVAVIIAGTVRLKRAAPVSSITMLANPEMGLSDFQYEDGGGCKEWCNQDFGLHRTTKARCAAFWRKLPIRFWNFYIDAFIVPSYRVEWGRYKEWSYRSPARSKDLQYLPTELGGHLRFDTEERKTRRSTNSVRASYEEDVTGTGVTTHHHRRHHRHRDRQSRHIPHNHDECKRIKINVAGCMYETQLKTLNRYPDTLLGNPQRRLKYYNPSKDEYFFDRNRQSFETILYFYQSGGRFRRPDNISADILLDDARFYGLPSKVIYDYLVDEGLTYSTQPDEILPRNLLLRKFWLLFDYPQSSLQARIVAINSVTTIILSITTFCLETEEILSPMNDFDIDDQGRATQDPFNPLSIRDPFFLVESVSCVWFTLEYLMRLLSCPEKLVFLSSALNIIDFIAITPYFAQIVFTPPYSGVAADPGVRGYSKSVASSFSTIRIVRLVRVFRIFKLSRHSKGLKILGKTLHASLNELLLLIMFVLIGVILFSSAIYFAERSSVNDRFPSIPDGFWWAVITITTVGYGDDIPDTTLGKVIGALCAVTGVLTISLPVPVIVSNFNFFYNQALGEQDLNWLKISHVPACPFRPVEVEGYEYQPETGKYEAKNVGTSGDAPAELKENKEDDKLKPTASSAKLK